MQGSLILCYHRIHDDNHSYLRPTKVSDFERQMRYLKKVYHPVPLEQIVQHIQDGGPLPKKSVAITFDDGYRDNYENAYPILRKYGLPATIFLTTGYVGTGEIPWWDGVYYLLNQAKKGTIVSRRLGDFKLNAPFDKRSIQKVVFSLKQLDEKERNLAMSDFAETLSLPLFFRTLKNDLMLSWDEVREMSNNAISFGGHTLTHPLLTRIPKGHAQKEIELPKQIIEEQISKSVTTFAYPSGDFDPQIGKMVKDAGYSAAVSVIPGYNRKRTDIYALRRNDIHLSSKFKLFPVFMAEVTGVLGSLFGFYDFMRRASG